MSATLETFHCMACGHEYQEEVEAGEDKERSCPQCRSNSIRQMSGEALPEKGVRKGTQVSRGDDDG
jgi:putative FmdB family regulatory protein